MPFLYCFSTALCFTATVTLLHQLNDEFDGISTRSLRSFDNLLFKFNVNLTVFGFLVAYGIDLGAVMVASVFMTIRIL